MFIPASTHPLERRAQRGRVPPGPRRSGGVQTAPRANTGTPLTAQGEPVALRAAASTRRARKPDRADGEATPLRRRSMITVVQRGSPWVCGHQRCTSGDPELAADPAAPSSRARSARHAPAATARRRRAGQVTRTGPAAAAPRRAAARRRRRPSTARTRVAAARRRARRVRRSSATGRHGPTTAGPGANPGARPSSIVRKKRRLPSATSRVRQRARGRRRDRQQRGQRPAADHELVVAAQPVADVDASGGRTSTRCSRTRWPLR